MRAVSISLKAIGSMHTVRRLRQDGSHQFPTPLQDARADYVQGVERGGVYQKSLVLDLGVATHQEFARLCSINGSEIGRSDGSSNLPDSTKIRREIHTSVSPLKYRRG